MKTESEHQTSTSGRRWLRRMGCLGLVLLAVTCVVMVTFRVVEGRAKGKVAAVLSEVKSERANGGRGEEEYEKEKEKEVGVKLAELELLGGAFADAGSEQRREFERRLRELSDLFVASIHGETGGPCDFRKLFSLLGGDPQDARSDAEVRAEVYRRLAGVLDTLQRLARDIERTPWAWRDFPRNSEQYDAARRAGSMLQMGLNVLSMIVQAEWLGGDPTSARTGLASLERAYAEVFRQPGTSLQREQVNQVHWALQQAFASGIRHGTWPDADLLQFARSLPPEPTVRDLRRTLEANRDHLARQLATDQGMAELRAEHASAPLSGQITRWPVEWLSSALMTEARLRENMSVVLADMDAILTDIDVRAGSWTPPEENTLPSSQLGRSLAGFEGEYFSPALRESFAWRAELSSFEEMVRSNQSLRLSAAMELYRRQHGEYAPSTDALQAATPFALPKEINGVPYTIEVGPAHRMTIKVDSHAVWFPLIQK